MNDQLRDDEECVIRYVAKSFSGTWRCGENPPDAYLTVNNRDIAVEISTLREFRNDGRGGTVPVLSDIIPAEQLAKELNKELQGEIPDGRVVVLTFESPFLNKRAVEGPLKAKIRDLLSSPNTPNVQEIFSGNKVTINISNNGATKIVALVVPSSLPRDDVLTTAWCILEERIAAKAKKYGSLQSKGPLWLALLDRYQLADIETYQQAMKKFSVDHPFEKILLVSHYGSVDELFEQSP